MGSRLLCCPPCTGAPPAAWWKPPGDNPWPHQHTLLGTATAPARQQHRRAGGGCAVLPPSSTLRSRCWDPPPAEPGAAGSRPALPWLHLGLHLIDNFPGAVTCLPLCMTRAGIHWSEIAWNKILELVKRLRRPPLPCCGGTQTLPAPRRAGWHLHAGSLLASKVFTSRIFTVEGKHPSESLSCKPARRRHPQPETPAPAGQSQPGEQTLPAPKAPWLSQPRVWVSRDPDHGPGPPFCSQCLSFPSG